MPALVDPRFGEAIKLIREKRGWKQWEVASRVETYYADDRSYRRIENAERLPARDAAIAILTSGLRLTDPKQIDQILYLAGHASLDAQEVARLGLHPTSPFPATPLVPAQDSISSLPRDLKQSSGLRTLVTIAAVCALALSGWLCASVQPHSWFAALTACLFAGLYVISLFLETSYAERPDSLTTISALIFALMVLSCSSAFAADHWCIRSGNDYGLMLSLSLSAAGAALQFFVARSVLPNSAIVPTNFATHTAHVAHLKNTGYFLLLLLFFWATPVHCVLALEQALRSGRRQFLEAVLSQPVFFGDGIVSLSLPWLVGILAAMIAISIPMGSRLLDNLTPGPQRNGYVALFYARAFLFFGLAVLCLGWYGSALGTFTALHP